MGNSVSNLGKIMPTRECARWRAYVNIPLPKRVIKVVRKWVSACRALLQCALVSWVRVARVLLEVCEPTGDLPNVHKGSISVVSSLRRTCYLRSGVC